MRDPIIITILCLCLCTLVMPLAWMAERSDWNKGKCRCGKPWKQFDADSQGGRGYKCARNHYTWISYPWID